MKKVLKVLRNIIWGIVAVIALILLCTFTYNRAMIKKEEGYWQNPPGQMVEVDGHKMHVYTEGEGEHTIVILTGVGTVSPYVDFLPMCKELSSENKVVIVERFGYGLSDVTGSERSFDTIVDQDREALKKLGIEGPYVLCPHSVAGLESLIWAQNYPEEVEAIVGMDMSDTSIKGKNETGSFGLQVMRAFRATGISRILTHPDDSEESKLTYAISSKSYINKDNISEIKHIDEACDMVKSKPLPTTPTLQIISKPHDWKAGHQEIVDASSNGKLVELDCGHYVYKDEQERVVREIRDFLNGF